MVTVAMVTLPEVGKILLFVAAFGILYFIPVIMLLLPWALKQPRDGRAAAVGLTLAVGVATLTVFSWVARHLA